MEVGKSAFVLDDGQQRVLLDYGVKIFTENKTPAYPPTLDDIDLDGAIISHAHLDHSGFVPMIYRHHNCHWYATAPTRDIANVLFQDSMKITPNLPWRKRDYEKALREWHSIQYEKEFRIGSWKCKFKDAHHILGSSVVKLEIDGKKVIYTGDFKTEKTRLHPGLEWDDECDVLIIESTYADRDHPDRESAEKELMRDIYATLNDGGTALLPAFAVGRSQELIEIIRTYDKEVPIYLDGMSKTITDIYVKYRHLLSAPSSFKKNVGSVKFVHSMRQRKMAEEEPSIIITTAGMLEGGPALSYIQHINPHSRIILTGYCVEKTNGWYLLHKNQIKYGNDDTLLDVSLPVKYIDFSAHVGRTGLFETVKKLNPEKVFCIHGDHPDRFAEELREMGFDAHAPNIGDNIELW